ncbi:MAG TPA: serine/threonine protein kinase [Bauldia sp.]|nr:serine/threonine protein kinase [Bauldia sp.]
MSIVHATAALVGGRGVLIRGASGSGKSSLLLALIDRAPAECRLVADDRVELSVEDGRLVARAPEAIAGLFEIRGLGIVRRDHVSPADVDLVVDLKPLAECPRLPSDEEKRIVLEGVALPRLILPANAADGAVRVRAALALME